MQNIRLTIAYKGTRYGGWQIQPNAVTVQEKISEAIEAVTGEHICPTASGRTDAGVHAAGQVANFITEAAMPPEKFAPALNTHLPEDIRVVKSESVDLDFHAQYSARQKTYCYRLYTGETADPFLDEYAWFVRTPSVMNNQLNEEAMRQASEAFIGQHDFKAFMNTGSPVKSTVREIISLEIKTHHQFLTSRTMREIFVTGTGFLYNMVRIIAGTLVAVGLNRMEAGMIPKIIEKGQRENAGQTAPARGLMLMSVDYFNAKK